MSWISACCDMWERITEALRESASSASIMTMSFVVSRMRWKIRLFSERSLLRIIYAAKVPSTESTALRESAPSRIKRTGVTVVSTTVLAKPPGVRPPSRMRSTSTPKEACTSSAVTAGNAPERLALVPVSGPPTASSSRWREGAAESRIPMVPVPAVSTDGTLELARNTMVNGPGQQAFINNSALGLISEVRLSRSCRWRINPRMGLDVGERPLSAKRR